MYAIIRTGGKQYKVQAGDVVRVEKLERDLGVEFDLTDVLLVGGEKLYVGEPLLKNAKVTVVVTQQAKDSKIVVFKKRRRQGYRRTQGHRQLFTELFVKSITSPEGDVSGTEKAAVVIDPARKAQRLAELAAKTAATAIEDGAPAKKISRSSKAAGKAPTKAKAVKKTKTSAAPKKKAAAAAKKKKVKKSGAKKATKGSAKSTSKAKAKK